MKLILVIGTILIGLVSTTQAQLSKTEAKKVVQDWIEANKEGHDLHFKSDSLWKVQCPIGAVCDENYSYRMFTMKDGNGRFTLSFKPQLAMGISKKALNENVKYFSMHYLPIDLENEGWLVSTRCATNDVRREGIEFTSWKNEKAIMHTNWKIVDVELMNVHDKGCLESYQIMDASIKEGCVEHFKVSIPLDVEIEAMMEDKRVVDMTDVDW